MLSATGNLGTAAKPSFPQPTADPDPSVRCWELEVRAEALVRCLWLGGSLLCTLAWSYVNIPGEEGARYCERAEMPKTGKLEDSCVDSMERLGPEIQDAAEKEIGRRQMLKGSV